MGKRKNKKDRMKNSIYDWEREDVADKRERLMTDTAPKEVILDDPCTTRFPSPAERAFDFYTKYPECADDLMEMIQWIGPDHLMSMLDAFRVADRKSNNNILTNTYVVADTENYIILRKIREDKTNVEEG